MKKLSLFIVMITVLNSSAYAQLLTYGNISTALNNQNVFLDGSSNFDFSITNSNNKGKGMVFPKTNLTTWSFITSTLDGVFLPTYFDGMIVYNTGTGNSATGTNNPSTATAVTPGFYYFSNPNGAANGNVTGGVWTAIGSGAVKNVTTTEVALSTKVNGAQLYAINGTFTSSGTSTAVSITVPSGMTGYFSFVTYKDGKTFRREIYSFNTATSTNNVICGTGAYSEVLPAGTYNYVLEYFK